MRTTGCIGVWVSDITSDDDRKISSGRKQSEAKSEAKVAPRCEVNMSEEEVKIGRRQVQVLIRQKDKKDTKYK